MRTIHILSLSTLLGGALISEPSGTTNSANQGLPKDYQKLVDYANLVSFAYCKELSPGKLGSKESGCPIQRCQKEKYTNLEILNLFDFNDYDSIGAGYRAIDHENKRIVLAFRGTSTNRDWFANLNVPFKRYQPLPNLKLNAILKCDGCKVHKGFYEFVEQYCVDIIRFVGQLKRKYPEYQLVVLGHSLGGVFALLSGIEFQLMGFEPLVITYASPKVGNKPMMKFIDILFKTSTLTQHSQKDFDFDHGYIRVVHSNDLVPMLPPKELGYYHGGVEYYIDESSLPHPPESLENRGQNHYSSSSDESPLEKIERITKSIVLLLASLEHTQYFIPITGCKDGDSQPT